MGGEGFFQRLPEGAPEHLKGKVFKQHQGRWDEPDIGVWYN